MLRFLRQGRAGGGRLHFIRTLMSSVFTVAPVADYDFVKDTYSGPTVSVSRASAAYVDDLAGNWTLVPANTLRRSNKGLLVEGAQTNSIRNNSMQGAVAGTPGTLPTNWVTSFGAGSIAVNGVVNIKGVDYLDVTFTAPSAVTMYLLYEPSASIPASIGQLWTLSSFLQIISSTNLSSAGNFLSERNSSGANLAFSTDTSATSSITRTSLSRTLNQTGVSYLYPGIVLNFPGAGSARLLVGWPQLEQWATSVTTVGGASSPIRTTGTAATRAADVVSMSGLTPLNAWTIAGVAKTAGFVPNSGGFAELSDGSPVNTGATRYGSTGTSFLAISNKAAAQSTAFPSVSPPAVNTRTAVAYAQDGPSGDAALSLNGAAPATATSTQSPTNLNYLLIGSTFNAPGRYWFGYIERLAVIPQRLSNSELQRLSTLSTWG